MSLRGPGPFTNVDIYILLHKHQRLSYFLNIFTVGKIQVQVATEKFLEKKRFTGPIVT